jgi:large subunit ribosomal protein L4
MATANAYDAHGQHRGSVDLPAELFEAQVHEHLLYQSVKTYLANQRQGTHKVKTRAEVSGGGKKPWRQKGTGRARSGSNTSPLWPGGGRAFGPKPRDYELGLPKKQRRAALLAALSLRAREGRVFVIEEPAFDAPKTSAMAGLFDKLGLGEGRTLFVLGRHDDNLVKSCRNLARVRATQAHQLTPYHLMESDQLVLTQGALDRLKEVFAS